MNKQKHQINYIAIGMAAVCMIMVIAVVCAIIGIDAFEMAPEIMVSIVILGMILCACIGMYAGTKQREYEEWSQLSELMNMPIKDIRKLFQSGVTEYHQSCSLGFSRRIPKEEVAKRTFTPSMIVQLPLKDIMSIYQASKYRCIVRPRLVEFYLGSDLEVFIAQFTKIYLKYHSNSQDIQTKLNQVRSTGLIKLTPTEEDSKNYEKWFYVEFHRNREECQDEVNATQYRCGVIATSALIPILHADIDAMQENANAELSQATETITQVAENLIQHGGC